MHILLTLFQKHDLRITRRLHPIIGIKRDAKGSLASLQAPKEGIEKSSYIYITFEYL